MQRYACMMRGLAHAWVCSLTGPDMAGEVVVKVKQNKRKHAHTLPCRLQTLLTLTEVEMTISEGFVVCALVT